MTFFFYGPNVYAMRRQVGDMREAYLKKAGSDFGLVRIEGSTASLQELSAALRASPFMATSRLVIVEGLALNKGLAGQIEELLGMVPRTTVAVFIDTEVDQRTTSFRALAKADKVVKFDLLVGPTLSGWIRTEVNRLGGSIDTGAVRELMDLAGSDQWRLSGEIGKLVSYQKEVTEDTVRLLVQPSVERSIFKLVEAMSSGRQESALSDYHGLLRQREAPMMVLSMIQWHLRNLLYAKTAPSSMPPAELAKTAGMSPYVAEKSLSAQKDLSLDTLKEAFRAAADCEYDIKSGRIGDEMAVERLIFGIAAGAGRR